MIAVGDCRDVLPTFPEGSVHTCVTSPPYLWLRDYGVRGQIGLEASVEQYVETLVEVFRAVRRVLRPDGTLWLNLGDTYAGSGPVRSESLNKNWHGKHYGDRQAHADAQRPGRPYAKAAFSGAKAKDLLLLPHRVAIALQADGWWVRSDIVWNKPNVMPESVTDRPTKAHEYLFLLAKRERYFFDATAIAEPVEHPSESSPEDMARAFSRRRATTPTPMRRQGQARADGVVPTVRNARSVWTIPSTPFKGAHFATFPLALAERCIRAGTSARGCCSACGAPWVRGTRRAFRRTAGAERFSRPAAAEGRQHLPTGHATVETTGWAPSCDCHAAAVPCTVLDPFAGAGTTLLAAQRLGRRGLGVELNPEYAELARGRLAEDAPLLAHPTSGEQQVPMGGP